MDKRRLGTTDIKITPLGLGCWQFLQGSGIASGFWPVLDDGLITEIIQVSLAGGMNWFDTAEAYGWGASERALARALVRLGKQPGDVVIATKWQPAGRFAGSIRSTIGQRLECLAPFPIDLHQVHNPASFSGNTSQMEAMADLLDAGLIRAVGVSNYLAGEMHRADYALRRRGYRLVANQVKYSLLDRRIEDNGVLAAAKELGVTIIAYSPLEQGLLTGKFHENPELISQRPGPRRLLPKFQRRGLARSKPLIDLLRSIAEAHGATPAQVALNWVVTAHGDTVVAIPGATKKHHAEQNVGALGFTLTANEIQALDDVSRQVTAK